MQRLKLKASAPARVQLKPRPTKADKLLPMKLISRRLIQDLATVYNWKNRRKDPLPAEETMAGLRVDETELLEWLAEHEPELVLTWKATADMTETQLAHTRTSMNKADVLVMSIRNILKDARAA